MPSLLDSVDDPRHFFTFTTLRLSALFLICAGLILYIRARKLGLFPLSSRISTSTVMADEKHEKQDDTELGAKPRETALETIVGDPSFKSDILIQAPALLEDVTEPKSLENVVEARVMASTRTRDETTEISRPPPKNQVGLLVNAELEQALKECKEKVERIARECRAANKKFRDIEFDLENDGVRCQFGLYSDGSTAPPDVKRVTEIFENPKFFVNGPDSNDIIQGALGDCWFLSALSTMTTSPGLVEKLWIARDEEVGVYGFIFFRDSHWVNVVIDDQLFWSIPKFEELRKEEQELYHEDRDIYNSMARKGGKGLRFAKSGTAGETWVPLIEKAYAKLHGDYVSLTGGRMSEGIEDLTGGVSVMFKTADILDPDRFWNEELVHANNKNHLFGVSFPGLDEARSGQSNTTVRGLYGAHAYSILKVKECKGKRFVIIRNPWGSSEWTGPWSDGSKEWNGEWIKVLKELDHVLGDDGEFVMEYTDFLETWVIIQRTTIFDPSWVMSSHWLRLPPKSPAHAWTYGDVFFSFTLPKASPTIIVLSQLDDRYFKYLDGVTSTNLDFVVYKRGETALTGESYAGTFCQRSVSCELDLEEGEYVVYPRIDLIPTNSKGYFEDGVKFWNKRKLARVLTERTKGRAIASNYEIGDKKRFIPTPLKTLIDQDSKTKSTEETKEKDDNTEEADDSTTTTTTTTTTVVVVEEKKTKGTLGSSSKITASEKKPTAKPTVPEPISVEPYSVDGDNAEYPLLTSLPADRGYYVFEGYETTEYGGGYEFAGADASEADAATKLKVSGDDEDENPLFLGLKVYTKQDAVVIITGRLPKDPEDDGESG